MTFNTKFDRNQEVFYLGKITTTVKRVKIYSVVASDTPTGTYIRYYISEPDQDIYLMEEKNLFSSIEELKNSL